jgi:hypothetical protein
MTPAQIRDYIFCRCLVNDDDCWIWQGALNSTGVPVFMLRALGGTRNVRAVAWLAAGRPLRQGRVFAVPECDSRCCNPEHMRYVTRREAMRLASARGTLSSGPRHAAAILPSRRASAMLLTAETVRQMRARYESTANAALVAREFGVSHSHAHRVCTHRAWRQPSWVNGL